MPERRRWACVTFDLDGTLVDSLPALYHVYHAALAEFGREGSPAEFARLNGPNLQTIVGRLHEWHALPMALDALYALYLERLHQAYASRVEPFAGASDLLKWAASAKVARALVTSTLRDLVEPVLTRHNWRGAFDLVVCGDEVREAKPSPAIYRLACERGGWAPAGCIAIEDAPLGVQSAVVAGLHVIGVHGDGLEAAGAHETCASLAEVQGVLREKLNYHGT